MGWGAYFVPSSGMFEVLIIIMDEKHTDTQQRHTLQIHTPAIFHRLWGWYSYMYLSHIP